MHVDEASPAEKLQLADWRRRVGELYAEVRLLAATDPQAAWNRWRQIRERLYREHQSSPVSLNNRTDFVARHFAYDAGLRFELPVLPTEAPRREADVRPFQALPMSVGRPISFDRVGWLDVPFEFGLTRLALYWLPEYSGGLFLPFRDATNGAETYGGGRYLIDSAKGADLGGDLSGDLSRSVVLDFNFAYQPSCAFDPRWSCPLSPPENKLAASIRAGERLR